MSRGAGLLVAIGLTGSWTGVAHAAPVFPPAQQLVTLLAPVAAHTGPSTGAGVVASVHARTPLTGVRTVLPVLAARAGGWLEVLLPGRPNGSHGWIRSGPTRRSETPWRLAVDLSRRRVTVYARGRAVQSFRAVVGKASTPTPTGTYFVEEAVRLDHRAAGAPFALALSARSNVLQEFDGGPGQIAIHGRDNIGGTLGTAASHGCVRLADDAMRWLVGRVGAGTPVTITP